MYDEGTESRKLDWMYKGPTSTVNREEYLLGRTADKTLEQLNDEEKQGQNVLPVTKNRVEHECIPPSIRDFNKIARDTQVDLTKKLQEDPLVVIKKREEESRREFLQNPVQLKKLQKALNAMAKKKKHKKSKKSHSEKDLDKKITTKLLDKERKKISREERDLETILIQKYQHMFTVTELESILENKESDSNEETSSSDSDDERGENRHRKHKLDRKKRRSGRSSPESRRSRSPSRNLHSYKEKYAKNHQHTGSRRDKSPPKYKAYNSPRKDKRQPESEDAKASGKNQKKSLSDREKDRLRQEMMGNATWREKEIDRNVKSFSRTDEKESQQHTKPFDRDFVYKQMLKSTSDATVESRIKSNMNNIQRSRNSENNFIKRH